MRGPGARSKQAVAARREAREEEFQRWWMMRQVDVRQELKKLVGEQAEFRSIQKPALQAIMQQKSPVVCIMGTGAGKSILFMLPAIMQDTGTSIVVVPFVALMEDLVTRAVAMGVDCIRFRSSLHGLVITRNMCVLHG